MHHRSPALRFRQHDGVRRCRHHGIEIGVGKPGGKRIDAHDQPWPAGLRQRLRQERHRAVPRRLLALGGDGIFQVEDEGVGAAVQRLAELGG